MGPTLGRPIANRHHHSIHNTERAETRANATAHARERKQAPDTSSTCLWALFRGRPRGGGRAHLLPPCQLDAPNAPVQSQIHVAAASGEIGNAEIASFFPLVRDFGCKKSLATSVSAKGNRSRSPKQSLRLRCIQICPLGVLWEFGSVWGSGVVCGLWVLVVVQGLGCFLGSAAAGFWGGQEPTARHHKCLAWPCLQIVVVEDQILTPRPQPQKILTNDFCRQPGLEWKFLQRRTWSGQKPLPLQFPGLALP